MSATKDGKPARNAPSSDSQPPGDYASPPCFMHEVDPAYFFAMPEDFHTRIRTKKIHDGPSPQDGRRILVERLWPRGVSKTAAALDSWAKEIAPSPELRKWYGHEPDRWPEFKRRYREELAAREDALEPLLEAAREGRVTLLFSTREEERNSASVLREWMLERLERET